MAFVMSSDGLPVSEASVHVYKHMGVITSADKKAGYSTSTVTESDGSYALQDLPSGVYKFTIAYPDGTIQTYGQAQVHHMFLRRTNSVSYCHESS